MRRFPRLLCTIEVYSLRYNHRKLTKFVITLVMLIVLLINLLSCSAKNSKTIPEKLSNEDTLVSSFNINFNLCYNISVDSTLKNINSDIIRATQQAIFDYDCSNAKLYHYDGYFKNNDILITI